MECVKHIVMPGLLLVLTSCGGGGGSDNNTEPEDTENVANTENVTDSGNGTVDPLDVPQQSSDPLDKLIGNVTFTSKFTNLDTLFRDSASFSTIETAEGVKLVFDKETNTACRIIGGAYEYFCAHVYDDLAKDLWYFDMGSNGTGAGDWEYCSDDVSSEACVSDLANTPDGSVSVRVSSARTSPIQKFEVPANMELIVNDVEAYKLAGDLQSPSSQVRILDDSKLADFTDLIHQLVK